MRKVPLIEMDCLCQCNIKVFFYYLTSKLYVYNQTMTPRRPVPSYQETAPKLLRSKQMIRESPFPPRPYGILGTSPATTYTPMQTTSKRSSKIEEKIREGLFRKSILKPLSKVSAKAKQNVKAPPETIETPAGVEPVLQKAFLAKRIEQEKHGETYTKNVTISNLNERNEMEVVEMGVQQIDPKFAKLYINYYLDAK